VVTTLDLRLQQLAEKALDSKSETRAIVIIDPNNGDILALASWLYLRSNLFVPPSRLNNSKFCRTIRTFPLLPRRIVRLIRRIDFKIAVELPRSIALPVERDDSN